MLTLLFAAKLALAGPSVTVSVEPPLVRALHLPIAARRLRHAGVSAVEVQTGLHAVRIQRVRAWDAVVIFNESVVITRRYGPMPHFGVFLESHLSRGMRGPDLVEAIVVENKKGWKDKDWKDKDWNPGHGPFDEKHGGKHADHGGDRVVYVDRDHDRGNSGRGNSGKSRGNSGHGNSGKGGKHGKGKD